MVITYHSGQCFKLSHGDTTIAFDPISKDKSAAWPAVKFGADVVFSSLHHPNFAGYSQMQSAQRTPYIVHGPGEYEIGDVTARGFGVKTIYENKERFLTIYQVQFEGMNIVFLGPLRDPEISSSILSALSDIDILFIPIGDGDVLSPPQASKLAVKLEAKFIIPMHFDKNSLATFIKEEGGGNKAAQEKLTIKKKDVLAATGELVVLQAK